ncbi:L,D-transpeptidase family protein [Pedobacter sp.]|uniref:L,D-transpeptidase family protein n=1 Tax=Pedobacter sp. TaxID=1411316 RepID=UPI0031D1C24C
MKTIVNLATLLFTLTILRCNDKAVSREIETQLERLTELNYPMSVKRFYKNNDFQSIWVQSVEKPTKTWSSMLLLDCVLQYGLSHEDYHPEKLLYPKLREILKDQRNGTAEERATFEIYLTDALLTLINDLHFGKANPLLPRRVIDEGNISGFSAEAVLKNALGAKDFLVAISDVQPKSQTYTDLQKYMFLIRGQYLDDCYTVPEEEVRKVAINMERAKWNTVSTGAYVEVNIPSYTLTYHLPDTSLTFKVAVGTPEKPTPELMSAISYIGTAPDWKVPNNIFINDILPKALKDIGYLEQKHYTIYDNKGYFINATPALLISIQKNPTGFVARQSSGCELSLGTMAFHFPNENGIYLHDGPQKEIFLKNERALTNGCVSVENAGRLASLMLKYDGQEGQINELLQAADNYQTKNFVLKKTLPLLIGYQTCAIKDGLLVRYSDPYNKDKELENNLYRHDIMLSKK